jgi:hypothetical protein
MSEHRDPAKFPRRVLERVITRDVQVPLGEDDLEMENGWRSIPIPPTSDPDDGWFILEDLDYKTVWGRWHDVEGYA